jgi:hypothetical protein
MKLRAGYGQEVNWWSSLCSHPPSRSRRRSVLPVVLTCGCHINGINLVADAVLPCTMGAPMLPAQTEVPCNKAAPVPPNALCVCSPLTFPSVDQCISGNHVLLHLPLDVFHLLHKTLTRALAITEPTAQTVPSSLLKFARTSLLSSSPPRAALLPLHLHRPAPRQHFRLSPQKPLNISPP